MTNETNSTETSTEKAVELQPIVMRRGLQALDDVTAAQCSNGNWNYDPYMHGMANGLLLAQSFFKAGRLDFLEAPDEWLKDKPNTDVKPVASSVS